MSETYSEPTLPALAGVLAGLRRAMVGRDFIWEPRNPRAYARCRVTAVNWNGEEFWVESETYGQKSWNELERFLEAISQADNRPQEVDTTPRIMGMRPPLTLG